jgi:hypothetical protein
MQLITVENVYERCVFYATVNGKAFCTIEKAISHLIGIICDAVRRILVMIGYVWLELQWGREDIWQNELSALILLQAIFIP